MKKFQPAFIQEKEIRELREALLGKGMNPAFIDPILQEEKKKTYQSKPWVKARNENSIRSPK